MYDDKGTSLVFVNSKKGQEIFNEIISDIKYQEVDINEASKYNPSSFKSVIIPDKRQEYFEGVFNSDFNKFSKKYTKLSFILRVKILIYNLLRR